MDERTKTRDVPPAEPELRGPDPNLYVADPLHEHKGSWDYLRHARAGWAVLALCLLTLVAWWIWNWVH